MKGLLKCAAVVAVSMGLLVACDDGGSSLPADAGVGGDIPPGAEDRSPCEAGCARVLSCDLCLEDASGACVERFDDCVEVCEDDGLDVALLCAARANTCDSGALSGCFDGTAVTDCMESCAHLDRCDVCLQDDDGDCHTPTECVRACASEPAERAACVAALADAGSCAADALEACLGDAGLGEDDCAHACQAYEDCGLCQVDAEDECLTPQGCVDACRAGGAEEAAVARCVAGVRGCDPAGFAACADAAIGDDVCARGCLALDQACDVCLSDEDEDCLSAEACAAACREGLYADEIACVAGLEGCDEDELAACFDEEVGDDDCARGCLALDACEFCEVDEDEQCLSVAGCAEACREAGRGAWGACMAAVDACDEDAIDACYSGPEDACRSGCEALDACELCEPDSEGECMDAATCAEVCRAEGEQARGTCLAAVDACDPDAIDACYLGVDDVCRRGCEALDACDLCVLDEEDECLGIAECAEVCRGDAEEEAIAACLVEVEACDEAAIDACYEPVDPPPTPCELACARNIECGEHVDPEGARVECEAVCPGWPAEDRECQAEAADCEALSVCLEGPGPDANCEAACVVYAPCLDAMDAEASCRAQCGEWPDQMRACVAEADGCEGAAACFP